MMEAQIATPIYLDYNATTPVDPEVREELLPFLEGMFGNPSSAHAFGQVAADAVALARQRVATLIGAQPEEIVFTAGGSEADNLAIIGTVFAGERRHVITQATEHPAVLATARYIAERFGVRLTVLPVDGDGVVDMAALAEAIDDDTALVSIMHANNETGTIQPIDTIAELCRERGVLLHTDAAQSVAKIPVRVDDLGVDLLSIAGHKLYAPKGIGALYVRTGVVMDPIIHGASHEEGRRAGTENVAGIAGLGRAAEIAHRQQSSDAARMLRLRDRLEAKLYAAVPIRLNGHPTHRLPNTLNVSFLGKDGNDVLARAPEVAASTGSACHSGETEPSPVLTAMSIPAEDAVGAVRLTLGRWSTNEDVEQAAEALIRAAS